MTLAAPCAFGLPAPVCVWPACPAGVGWAATPAGGMRDQRVPSLFDHWGEDEQAPAETTPTITCHIGYGYSGLMAYSL